jgi:hypothetical protein
MTYRTWDEHAIHYNIDAVPMIFGSSKVCRYWNYFYAQLHTAVLAILDFQKTRMQSEENILRSIELFIYIQTNVCVNVNAYAFKK